MDATVADATTNSSVDEAIDRMDVGPFQTWTITLCGIVLLLDGFDTQSMGFLVPSISDELRIPASEFGPVLAAGLVGLMVASMASGPIADRWGRRWPIICSTVVFGVFSIFTARARTLDEFVVFRFLTGLGLGGAMPNVVALASEYSPKRLQAVLVSILFSGMGAGALVASMAASVMLPRWGWPSVLYLGGVLPLLLAVVLIAALPESIRFLTVRGAAPERIAPLARRLGVPAATLATQAAASRPRPRQAGLTVVRLFTEGRGLGTVLLWVPFFMNLLIIYFVLSWLPTLLRQAGMPVSAGIAGVSAFSLGGVIGSLIEGRWINRFGAFAVLLAEFLSAMALITVLAYMFESYAVMLIATFVLGVAVQGAQGALNAMASIYYPTTIRSTGVGWCSGIGRIGSIIGPLIGGMLLSLAWTPRQIFLAGVLPAVCCVVVVSLSASMRTRSPYFIEFRSR